jgi:hypothetical protein
MIASAWSFGWEALVAIGTLSLAAVTLALVLATRSLARQASAAIRAEWRPVLLVRGRVPAEVRGHQRGIAYNEGTLSIFVENVGRGPALDVQAELPDFGLPGPGYGVPEGAMPAAGGMSTRYYTAIAPGDLVAYTWESLGNVRHRISGSFSYTDMSGGFHSTSFDISFEPHYGAQLAWQRVEEPLSGSR